MYIGSPLLAAAYVSHALKLFGRMASVHADARRISTWFAPLSQIGKTR